MHLEQPVEMNILVAGNSQVACLKIAYRLFPEVSRGRAKISFYCFPGGWGPSFVVKNGRLAIIEGAINKDYPPFADPPDTPDRPIDEYDAIVVSALGSIGGGFGFAYDLQWRGTLHEFAPKENPLSDRLVSRSCYREIVRHELSKQHGFEFLTHLRKAYSGQIVVQPFPRISAEARDRADWCLNRIYEDAIGAHHFFSGIRDQFLEELSAELSLDLLPYPEDGWLDDHFTPAEFFEQTDGIHPGSRYGKLVLEQIMDRVKPAPLSDEAIQDKERETLSNREKYADIDFISLGEDGFSKSILSQWGLGPAGGIEEISYPFDLAAHPLRRIAGLINSDFANYIGPGDLQFCRDKNFCRNEANNVSFNYELGPEYSEDDFKALRGIYDRRIENFRKRMTRGGRIVFVLHLVGLRPNALFYLENISRAVKKRFQTADTLLICVNTCGSDQKWDESKRKLLREASIEIVDAPYPAENHLWHLPRCSLTPEGHGFEKRLISDLKAIIDHWN